ncbi:MAG: amidohydrolase family protein [Nocardiaceae bacterium]|nr:amidohydrolase family protein [Nocardiaceae bacterium]
MFDAHMHVIDPRFPLVANSGYLPEPYTIADYQADMAGLDVQGGAVVSGSFQVTHEDWMRAALEELGPSWVGVIALDMDATDDEIVQLNSIGVRAMRLNLKRFPGDIATLTRQAKRAHEIAGWHAEIYVDGSILESLRPVLARLPAITIDHLGLDESALSFLLELVNRGAHVKASGFGRAEHPDLVKTLRQIHSVNPHALVFGSDLPSTRAARAFQRSDLDIIREAVGDDADMVFDTNARELYRIT